MSRPLPQLHWLTAGGNACKGGRPRDQSTNSRTAWNAYLLGTVRQCHGCWLWLGKHPEALRELSPTPET